MRDPYEVMGLTRDALAEDVKQRYRELAQARHPDKGGTDAAFVELAEAFSLLSDPDRRKRYDETGSTTPGNTAATIESMAVEQLVSLSLSALEQLDPDGVDLRTAMIDSLGGDLKKKREELAKVQLKVKRARRAAKRFGGERMPSLLTNAANMVEAQEGKILDVIAMLNRMIEILNDHTYAFTQVQPGETATLEQIQAGAAAAWLNNWNRS